MALFHGFNISASALTAQRLRMDVISSNVANAETTRGKYVNGEWVPYRRKMVIMEPKAASFNSVLHKAMGINTAQADNGVKVTQIAEDRTPFKRVYSPSHPDADQEGYVHLPNVDLLKEMVDMVSASRSYEANVTALNASKSMIMKALEIGR
jgi:flagellar basal-body rod protein FlgC